MPKKHNPLLWNYFQPNPEDKIAECKQCHKKLSYKTTSANIKQHLKIKHVNSFNELHEKAKISPNKPKPSFPKINNLLIWNYFEQDQGDHRMADCRLCRKKLSYKTTITNLKQHLKQKHVRSYNEFVEQSESVAVEFSEEDTSESVFECWQPKPFDRGDAIKMDRESSVWSFFTKKPEFIATCNTCSQDYSYRASTSNLRKHWKNKHGKYLEEKPSDLSENNSDNSDEEQGKAVVTIVNKTKSMASWKYFDPLDLEKCEATCKICTRTLSFKYMSDLKQHVQDHGHEPADSDDEFVPEVQKKKAFKRRHKSKVWKFFRATDAKTAECVICHNLLKYGSTISNLRRHLMRKHGETALPSQDGESNNIIEYEGNLYEIIKEDDDERPKDLDAVYLNEEHLEDSFDSAITPPTPKRKLINIPIKRNSKITKEQVHSTRDTCFEEQELPRKPIPTYTNAMGSLDYFGQYVVSLLKELPKPVSDQLQSEIIKQILTSKMALQSQTVVAKYDIIRSEKNDTNVPEPISYTVVQSNETAETLNEITESAVKE